VHREIKENLATTNLNSAVQLNRLPHFDSRKAVRGMTECPLSMGAKQNFVRTHHEAKDGYRLAQPVQRAFGASK
jgi:hypothetical protein